MPQKITAERAQLLATHARVVQGGFSTPENEKERAEKDIANGAVIDFDKIRREVVEATIAQSVQQEADAAELEGLAPMPEDLVPLRNEKLLLDEEVGRLNARLREIKDAFGGRLQEENLQGFILDGKVHARRTPGTRTSVDSKKLKDDLPHIYKEYLRTTSYVSINIS